MRLEIIEGNAALAGLRASWEAVYDADPEAQFFLSWTWMSRWLQALGNRWFILAAREDEDGSPFVAFMPLRIRTREHKDLGFHNDINLAGNYAADYCGLISRPESADAAIMAFAGHVRELCWAHLRLEYFTASEHRAQLFLQHFPDGAFAMSEAAAFNADNIDNNKCPFVSLPDDWDRYLESKVSANTRQKVRRFLRQVENSGEFRITHADADTIGRDIDILLRFWETKWGPRKGDQLSSLLNTNRVMLRHAFDGGALFMPVLWKGDRPVGALGILVDDRKKSYNFYIAGRDESFNAPPPGLVLHAYSIRHAIRNGMRLYDFLRGDEPYKYSFGCEERQILSLIVTRDARDPLAGRLDARSIPVVLQRSIDHQKAGRLTLAERGLQQVLEIDAKNVAALSLLAQLAVGRGDHVAASKLLRALVGVRPDSDQAWHGLARALQARGELAQAADAYCEAIRIQPALAGACQELGRVLLGLGLAEQGVLAFEAALGLKPDLPGGEALRRRALQMREALTPKEHKRRAAAHAALVARVAKLEALLAAAARYQPPPEVTTRVSSPPRGEESSAPRHEYHAGSAGGGVIEWRPPHRKPTLLMACA